MQQLQLFPFEKGKQIVNVASVPKRSPFRYPGGKTWLVPWIREWLYSKRPKPDLLIEPFAGGAIVGLTAACERLTERVLLVELDPDIASVWRVILGGDSEWLVQQVVGFDLNWENVERILADESLDDRPRAFRTLLRNRINHGGILAPGSGALKNGENGRGIHSRWYPGTIAQRIRAIAAVRERIEFQEGDGIETMSSFADRSDVVFFVDPPYTAAGKRAGRRLYTYFELDHPRLFSVASKVAGDVLLTYDNAEEVQSMAHREGFDVEVIPMKNTHHAEMTELIIGKDLSWART